MTESSGIGYATIQHLARRGAKVYMAARNESKARDAIAKLKEEGLGPGNGEVLWQRSTKIKERCRGVHEDGDKVGCTSEQRSDL